MLQGEIECNFRGQRRCARSAFRSCRTGSLMALSLAGIAALPPPPAAESRPFANRPFHSPEWPGKPPGPPGRLSDRRSRPHDRAHGARTPQVSPEIWPTDTYDTDSWALFNDEAIVIEHPHAAHTDGDSIVFFRRSDVISTGDVFTPDRYPVIDLADGGTINGEIDALNRLLDIMVPRDKGRRHLRDPRPRPLCDRADAVTITVTWSPSSATASPTP